MCGFDTDSQFFTIDGIEANNDTIPTHHHTFQDEDMPSSPDSPLSEMSSLRDSDFFEEEEEEEVLPSPPEANTTTSAPTPTDDDDDDDDDMDWERASRTPAYITETYDLSDSDLARELDAFYGVDAAVQSSEAEGRVDEEKEEGEGEDEEEEEEEELEEVMLVMTREEYVQEALNVLTNS